MLNPRGGNLVAGAVLVLIGSALLLSAMGVDGIPIGFVLWGGVGVCGGVLAVKGWTGRSSVLMFIGAYLMLAGATLSAWVAGVFDPGIEEALAWGFLWIGLSFAFVWLAAPHKLDVLALAVLFGGPGVGYYLWWWDLVRVDTLRTVSEDGWPVLIILAGAGILIRSLRLRRQ